MAKKKKKKNEGRKGIHFLVFLGGFWRQMKKVAKKNSKNRNASFFFDFFPFFFCFSNLSIGFESVTKRRISSVEGNASNEKSRFGRRRRGRGRRGRRVHFFCFVFLQGKNFFFCFFVLECGRLKRLDASFE